MRGRLTLLAGVMLGTLGLGGGGCAQILGIEDRTTCDPGLSLCESNGCTDTTTDIDNCGYCGNVCGAVACLQGWCGGPPDAGLASCTANAYYGDLGPLTGVAIYPVSGSTDAEVYEGRLNWDPAFDVVKVELLAGGDPFPDGLKPGTYTIGEREAQYATCNLCVRVLTNVDSSGNIVDNYLATSGEVTLTSVQGRITGSLRAVRFTHVSILTSSPWTSTPINDCSSALLSADFDAAITTQ
jgi:hypothetical protein